MMDARRCIVGVWGGLDDSSSTIPGVKYNECRVEKLRLPNEMNTRVQIVLVLGRDSRVVTQCVACGGQ